MSLLSGLFGSNTPDENYIDDQSMQADYRDNKYVGHAIDIACTVYDTLFDALKFMIRGKSNVLEKMDKAVAQLEKQCQRLVDKYKEILSKLGDVGAGLSVDLSFDLAKEAFDILNSNPLLRRYVGEANYWMLWDMLAVLSGKGVSVGADIASNIKNAIKGTIYALLSMTNGMLHFESYISQLTSFWGWLYMKEIWLPLTDSICPQVTCAYRYKEPEAGNPVPGPANYAPMPFPIFDQEKYSWPYIQSHFSYDDPDTWDVLLPESRNAMQKAYNYWKSNYTNAVSANDLLSGASTILTGGMFTVGFGPRNNNYGGEANNSPLKIGATFNQLDNHYGKSFQVVLGNDDIAKAFANVDAALNEFITRITTDKDLMAARDAAILEYTISDEYPNGNAEYVGEWKIISDRELDWYWVRAGEACFAVIENTAEFKAYVEAITKLSVTYHSVNEGAEPYNSGSLGEESPLVQYLVRLFGDIVTEGASPEMRKVMDEYANYPYMAAPYAVYSDDPDAPAVYSNAILWHDNAESALYSAGSAAFSTEMDVDEELGRPADGGRIPLYTAFGIYGNLKGMHEWDYKVVPLESFREKYARIRGSYHIYYLRDDPSQVIFADHVMRVGTLKYIATCDAKESDHVQRGKEEFTAYIFPGETCAVTRVPNPAQMYGTAFPSLASLQRVDAVGRDGTRYMYDLTRNQIPRYPKYVDPDKWSIMDIIHELWLLADFLAPICGDGGERQGKLNDLLGQFGIQVHGKAYGPQFIGQLPTDNDAYVTLEFNAMNEFATRIRNAIEEVYRVRDEVEAATRAW